jgi:TIGR03009 family protein
MKPRFIAHALFGLLLAPVLAAAQQPYPPEGNYPPPANQNVQPGQPDQYRPADRSVQPGQRDQYPQPADRNLQPEQPGQPIRTQPPTLARRDAQPPRPPTAPFTLTPQQQAYVVQVLKLWEERNNRVKTFDTRFKRWTYDTVFGRPDQPRFVDIGVIKYSSPDKGMFRVDTTEQGGREVAIDPTRAEDWKCDGKAIIEYNHKKKQMIVHKLPPEMQGKAIADGPLPFLFGATAKSLDQRYFIRIVTPREVQGQVWIEAFPRFQADAANFHHAQLIITNKMEPFALQMIQPNGKDKIVYQFYDTVINDPMRIFRGDPFRASAPFGWQSIVEEPPNAQARRPANDGRR